MVVGVVKQKKFGGIRDTKWTIEMRGGGSGSETIEVVVVTVKE